MAFFSVIIPLYNKEKFIESTIKCVLAQRFTDFELIIVNDGSTDSSEKIAGSFTDSRIRYFQKANEGASAARNFGISQAASEYVAFIDADDYWYPEFLSTMYESILAFPNEKVFAAAIEIETEGHVLPARYSIKSSEKSVVAAFFEASLLETIICTSAVVIHKDVLENVGQFDTAIKSGEDIDLWIRIGLKYNIVFSSQILARYVYDAAGLSKKVKEDSQKLQFSKYAALEETHPALKKYLDLNRYSLGIKAKLNNDSALFGKYFDLIDRRKLPIKKKILIRLSPGILRKLISLQRTFAKLGLATSVFK